MSIAKEPILAEVSKRLNYQCLLALNDNAFLYQLQITEWNNTLQITDQFCFEKKLTGVNDFVPEKNFHLIYFDAFAQANAPEMWHPSMFEKLYHHLLPNGCLVSFCAKGEFKRHLKQQGFVFESLPGPKD